MLFALSCHLKRFILILFLVMSYCQTIFANSELLTKQGQLNSVHNNVSDMQWILGYRNQSTQLLNNVILLDVMDGGQSLVPSSLNVPAEWSVTYSTNQGQSYSYDGSITGINAIKFTNPYVLPNGDGEARLMSLPLAGGVKMEGGGDGFAPVLMPNGRIMGVNHHLADAVLWCYDLNTRATCPSYPRKLGAANGMSPMVVRKGLRLYIGDDSGGNSYGQAGKIYCWDTETHSACGSSPVVEGGGYVGPVEINNKLYVWTRNGTIDCYDPNAGLKRCANFSPVPIGLNALDSKVWWENGNDLLVINSRLYVANTEGKLACFDATTQAKCVWTQNPISTVKSYTSLFKRLDASGQVTGVCAAGYKQNALCYDLNGNQPSSVPVAPVHAVQAGINAQHEVYYGSRVLFPQMYPENSLGCWDWATSAPCKGAQFTNGILGQNTAGLPYGLAIEGVCAYSFGDEGTLLSWDIETGASPCRRVSGAMQVSLTPLSCAATPSQPRWDKIKILDANLAQGAEFQSLKIKVLNAKTGAILIGDTEAVNTNGEMDISFISSAIDRLELIAQGEAVDTVPWRDGVPPKIALLYTRDQPAKFCYRSTATCTTSTRPVSNQLLSNYGGSVTAQMDACNLAPVVNVFDNLEYLNSQSGVVVDVYSTDDKDAESNGLKYSLSGVDAHLFNIDVNTGVITFKSPPDYAKPLDADKNNLYQVTVTVTDRQGAMTTKQVTIAVESDIDGDGIKDELDDDMDGDGIPNDKEGDGDLDGDGIPSKRDPHELPTAFMKIKVLFQGAYDANTGLMRDDLRRLGLIPLKQPYGAILNSMYEGTESLDPSLLQRTDANAPVDWVLLELRKADAQATLVTHRAAIVLRNGDIIDPMTANTTLKIAPIPAGYYYVVVRHRNHAAIVTKPAIWLSTAMSSLDFTEPSLNLSGEELAQVIQNNRSMMSAGDGNQDGRIIVSGPNNDMNVILEQVLRDPGNKIVNLNYKITSYNIADYDLNGYTLFSGPNNDTNTLMSAIVSHQGNPAKNMNYIITSGLRLLLDERPLSPYPAQKQ
ncbi:MAG: cadherin domain-containing protein [Thiofilum sp.]|uniref:cadherin domain-containing protein n=2 Tax=Thiofilum sp. TaxID=2212733 RepID=UPI0025FA2E1B|nr:cadherin domain-containing protein [Thiofilum sp.]MBK8452999.1 cadherin domain-containing protein [Thiofilum sp.]